MRPDSLLRFWCYINHLLTYLRASTLVKITSTVRFITLFMEYHKIPQAENAINLYTLK